MKHRKSIRVLREMPELAEELHRGFLEIGRCDLAAQVAGVEIVERCRCGDDFCATFYAQPKDNLPQRDQCEELVIPMEGLMCVQIAHGRIAWVELLFRADLREQLRSLLP